MDLSDLLLDLPAEAPGPPAWGRQPVHTVYGGAHLFRAGTAGKLGALAATSLGRHAPDPLALARALGLSGGEPCREDPEARADLAGRVFARVVAKLEREPVEDYRLDFEDGYGERSDEEEDGHCRSAAGEMARGLREGTLPPFVGIRLKPLTRATGARALRTLDLFLRALGPVPSPFLVTIPKVEDPTQPSLLVDALERLERELGLPSRSVDVELMLETPGALLRPDGTPAPRALVAACRGRCRAVHFGAYDYTAALGVSAACQDLAHPACDFARAFLQVALHGAGVALVDGATARLPVPPGEGSEEEDRRVVHAAWRLHFDNVRRALRDGLYQGWDLHPAQLVPRHAAVFSFFLEGLGEAAARLRHFVEREARATRTGAAFDDRATGQGLLNHLLRGLDCGALDPEEVEALTGVDPERLRARSFSELA